MPQGSDLGVPWGLSGQKNFFPKFNQIWCVSNLHQWHMQQHNFLVPTPWGPGEGPKGQISLNLNHSQFQRFFNQTLCVFSQMKDMKHIRRDFRSVAWVMPQGWDLRVPWGVGGSINFFSQIQPDLVCELLT